MSVVTPEVKAEIARAAFAVLTDVEDSHFDRIASKFVPELDTSLRNILKKAHSEWFKAKDFHLKYSIFTIKFS